MRVLFVTPQPVEGPSSRFRIYQYLPYLQSQGVVAKVRPFLSSQLVPAIYREGSYCLKMGVTLWGTAQRVLDALRARNYDIAYVLREAFPFGPPLFERAIEAAAGRLVFDFDDAIYAPSLAYRNPLDRLRDFGKPAKLIRLASHIIAGNDHLRDYAARFTDTPSRITVIPTVVDTSEYAPSTSVKSPTTCVIGWIGTPRGSSYLKDLLGVFADLARTLPQASFKFVGAQPFETGSLPITFKPWRLADEVADLQSFDIGIMPLTDDEETRGKCGFKLIQYMSVGIPVICSPVGANLSIVDNETSGYFASTPSEWLEKLKQLVQDPGLRRRLGHRGRQVAEERFSLKTMAPRLLAVLRSAAASSATPIGRGLS